MKGDAIQDIQGFQPSNTEVTTLFAANLAAKTAQPLPKPASPDKLSSAYNVSSASAAYAPVLTQPQPGLNLNLTLNNNGGMV
jgi:hypothetical protein